MDKEEVEAAAGRMQTKWYRMSKTVDEQGIPLIDYVSDLCILADAWLEEHGYIQQPRKETK